MPVCNKPVRIHCKAGSVSVRKHEANVRTLWPEKEMMVSPMKLKVLSETPKQLSRSANPSHLKTRRSENNLRLCGTCWQNSSKFSSLKVMAQVPSLFLRSTPVHKFSASRIEETALENRCSNLPLLEADSCLLLLHLTCVFLVFLVKCCNGFSLKPTRPMCDGRLFESSPFCSVASRGAPVRGFPFRRLLHFVLLAA